MALSKLGGDEQGVIFVLKYSSTRSQFWALGRAFEHA
jgi:hypothetical protein